MCVLILLDVCPHTTIYVFSYYYICVLILLYMRPHTARCVSSYNYICVLIKPGVPQLCPHRRKGSKGIGEARKGSMLKTEAFRHLECPEGKRCQVNDILIL
jgi:hypothetical protein